MIQPLDGAAAPNPFADRIELLGGRVTLAAVVAGAAPSDDLLVADAVRAYADHAREFGRTLRLEDVLSVVPWAAASEHTLEAAVDESLESALSNGDPLSDAADSLLRACPVAAAPIRRAVLRRAGLTATTDPDALARGGAVFPLPREFGPPDLHGRPRYDLRSVVGVGGQGVVYAAVDRLFSEPTMPHMVAVKVFHARGQEPDAARTAEALRARRVVHEGVVRATDRGVDPDGHAYAVFELVEGLPLDRWAEANPDTGLHRRVRTVLEVAEAVEGAHAFGVVHRDLKPSNILLDRAGRPRVSDFGIARLSGLPLDSTGAYSTRGSLAFMSPEQYHALPESDAPTTDVYALGGLLYWFLTGNFPNGGTTGQAMLALERAGQAVRAYPASIPSDLRLVCERALAYLPGDRHRSAAAFAADLRDWLARRPIAWTNPGPSRRLLLSIHRNLPLVALGTVAVLGLATATGAVMAARVQAERDRAIQIEIIERERLAAQAAVDQERIRRLEAQRAAARELVSSWKTAMLRLDGYEPAQHIALLTAMGNSEIFTEALGDQAIYLQTAESADVGLNLARHINPDSLETALWKVIKGYILDELDEHAMARIALADAEAHLTRLVGADDPITEQVRQRIATLDVALGNPATPNSE